MKKALFIMMVVMAPVLLLAQPLDTVTIYFENFDGATNTMVPGTAPSFGGSQGDFRVVGPGISYSDWTWVANYDQIYKSSPHSYRSPLYNANGNATTTTAVIPLSYNNMNVNHVYFDFDQICKVHQLDVTSMYCQVAG